MLLALALPVQVETNTGESLEGDLISIAKDSLVVETKSGEQNLEFSNLLSVRPSKVDEDATGPKFRANLIGGSEVAIQDLRLEKDTLTIEPRRQPPIELSVRDVKSIRLRLPNAATDPQWLGLQQGQLRGDSLVIRRDNGQLDRIQGIVEGIANKKVAFKMGAGDDTPVNAPFAKIEGVVFGGKRQAMAKDQIQVRDVYGSRWAVTKIESEDLDDGLILFLASGVKHKLPAKHLESIFWSGGFQLVASLEAAKSGYKPYLESNLSSDLLAKWFAPKMDANDIVMAGGSSIEYRLSDEFTTLSGAVRRDVSVANAGEVTLRVLLDDKEVWSERLQDEPLGFELPVAKSRRLRFVAESGKDGDLGDLVRITRPRLLK